MMIRFRVGSTDFLFSFWFFAVLAAFALLSEGALALYLLLPVAVHELGHLLMMALCRVDVQGVSFTAFGIGIRRGGGRTLGYGREIAICLGGVLSNTLTALALHLLFFRSMRVMLLVAANIAVAVFNLAPIGGLDGGQVIGLLAERFFTPSTARILPRIASFLVLGLLIGLTIFLFLIRQPNPTLLILCGYLSVYVVTRD